MFFDLASLRAWGSRPCLLTREGQVIRYAELAQRVERQMARFAGQPKSLVAVEACSDPESISVYLAALAAGQAVMPLPAADPQAAASLAQRFAASASFVRLQGQWQWLQHDWPHATPHATPHADLALLLQTSGSTGQGRGVRLSYQALQANAESIVQYLGLTEADRAALVLPLHYSYGLSVLHSHLQVGASLWLHPQSLLHPQFATELAASGATNLAGVPHHFNLLEGSGLIQHWPASLRFMTVAGGAMEAAKVRQWAERLEAHAGQFFVMYGQTEATARIAWLPPELAQQQPQAVGIAIPGGELLLRDEQGQVLQGNEVEGELVYRGANVMMGYAESTQDLSRGAELQELATGDLAYRDKEGIYRITGRLSRMSKIAGVRIGHDALERALATWAEEVAVWGDDRQITLVMVGLQQSEQALLEQAARLSKVGRQHFRVQRLPSLPRRANGKIDYPALKAVAPARPVGQSVLAAFRATFAGREVKPSDSFASLRGDSLSHVELTLALEERLGGLPVGWERLSIAELEKAEIPSGHHLPTELLARVVAIIAVVVAHQTFWPVYGGAAAMVILMGMSVAAFRWEALLEGNWRSYLRPLLGVLVPYYLVLAGFALVWGKVPWVSVALLGNFALTVPDTQLMLPYLYWFIEAYVQMTLLVALPFCWAPLRRWLNSRREQINRCFQYGLWLFALAVLLRLTLPLIWPLKGLALFTLPWVFYLFALGWLISAAQTARQRGWVVALACVMMPLAAYLGGNWHGGWIKYMSLLALVMLLCWRPQLRVPGWSVRPLMRLAQAAFPIYLLHRLVPEGIMPLLGWEGRGPWLDTLAIVGGIGLGLCAASVQRSVLHYWAEYRQSAPSGLFTTRLSKQI